MCTFEYLRSFIRACVRAFSLFLPVRRVLLLKYTSGLTVSISVDGDHVSTSCSKATEPLISSAILFEIRFVVAHCL